MKSVPFVVTMDVGVHEVQGANESRGAVATRESKANVSGESFRNVRTDMETKMPTNMSDTTSGRTGRNACSGRVIHDLLRAVERGIQVGFRVKPCPYPLQSEQYRWWVRELEYVLALSMTASGPRHYRHQRLRCRPCARRRATRCRRGGGRGGGRGGDGPAGGDPAPARLHDSAPQRRPDLAGPWAWREGCRA